MAETGSPTIDALLEGGVIDGDNVVWVTDRDDDAACLVSAFMEVRKTTWPITLLMIHKAHHKPK